MPEKQTTDRAVYTAIPTLRINGQADAKVADLLLGMEMVEHEGGMSALELLQMAGPCSDLGASLPTISASSTRLRLYRGGALPNPRLQKSPLP